MLIRCLAVICAMSLTIPILGLTSDALAQNITLRKASLKGVACDEVAKGMGNVIKDPKVLTCVVAPPAGTTTQTGLVVCGNPGKKINTSPGIQVGTFNGTFEAFSTLDPKSCDKNGTCTQTVSVIPSATQLATLNTACPNVQNWVAIDFAPCAADITVQVVGTCAETGEQVLAQSTYFCELPNCTVEGTVTWDRATQRLVGPDYNCTPIPSSPNLNPC